MKKKIMIFGAGENQLSLIKASKKLGVESIVIDPNSNAPGKEIADHFEVVGSADYDRTKGIALKFKVDGIVTSQMENPLLLMAILAEDIGYIFPSKEAILNCRNKFLMKKAFLNNGIPCANGIRIDTDEVITPHKIKDFLFPLIIKPIDSWSSKGVYRVNDYSELAGFEKQTRKFSSDRSYLLEEFIEGKEYSVESLTYANETTIIQITEKIITPYPYTVEMGHIQPAELNSDEKTEIEDLVKKVIRALGINNSATHTELKLTQHGPVIIEIGARLGGDFISSYLTLASTGINMDEGAINIALGKMPDVNPKMHKFSYIKYLELPAGKVVVKMNNWQTLRNSPGVVYASVGIKEGQVIQTISDSTKRVGFVIVEGESRDEAINGANEKAKQLRDLIQMN